jgi:hypothetical protein
MNGLVLLVSLALAAVWATVVTRTVIRLFHGGRS